MSKSMAWICFAVAGLMGATASGEDRGVVEPGLSRQVTAGQQESIESRSSVSLPNACAVIEDLDAYCLIREYSGERMARLVWTASGSDTNKYNYFIYRRNAYEACESANTHNVRHHYRTFYAVAKQTALDLPLDSSERACYRLQSFCYADAYRSEVTEEEKCACGDLKAFYQRQIKYPPWHLNESTDYLIDRVLVNDLSAPPDGKLIECSDVDIIHVDQDSVPASGSKPLQWAKSSWHVSHADIYNNTFEVFNAPPTLTVPYTLNGVDPAKHYWAQGNLTYAVTANIPDPKGTGNILGQCRTEYEAFRALLRTPEAVVEFHPGTGHEAAPNTFWGCSLCDQVTLHSKAPNYDKCLSNMDNDKLVHSWRVSKDGAPAVFYDKLSIDYSTSTDNVNSAVGHYIVNNRNYICHSNTSNGCDSAFTANNMCPSKTSTPDDIIDIYQSPPTPAFDGPVSICKDEPAITLTAQNPVNLYGDFAWWECNEPSGYSECYTTSPPSCFDETDWVLRTGTPQVIVEPPAMGKQKELYLRANSLMDGTMDRKCFGQQFITLHYKDCMSLPPYTHGANPFFPATSNLQETLPFAPPRDAQVAPVTHSNLMGGNFALMKDLMVPVDSSLVYRISVWANQAENGNSQGILTAAILNYNAQGGLIKELEVPLVPNQAPGPFWNMWSGTWSPAAGAVSVGIEIRYAYFSGWLAFDDISLTTGESPNLLAALDPSFETDVYWMYDRPDPRFPGTGWLRTDGGGQDYPLKPMAGNYLFFHNLASGAIESAAIDIKNSISMVRVLAWVRGESFNSLARLAIELVVLDDAGDPVETLKYQPPFATSGWSPIQADFTPTVQFSGLKVRLGASYLDGWAAYDDVVVIPFDQNGHAKAPLDLPNSGFEAYDCSASPCTLTGWNPLGADPSFPGTSVFHPAYYPDYYPLDGFTAWGPVSSDLSAGKFALSISNQMYAISSLVVDAPSSEQGMAEYELGLWIRGRLLQASAGSGGGDYDAPLMLEMQSENSDGTPAFPATLLTLSSDSPSDAWKQERFTAIIPPSGRCRIRLITPFLNGWVAYDDVTFGVWNRPPKAVALDTRYIPNQEQDPTVFANLESFDRIKADGSLTKDPDSGHWTAIWQVLPGSTQGDARFSPNLIDEGNFKGHLQILDGQSPAYLRLNQETRYEYKLRAEDTENPALFSEDTGTIVVEPFYALNAGFEAMYTQQLKEHLVYWTQKDDDDRFPGTGTPLEFNLYGPGMSGKQSLTKTNLATGYITSKSTYPLDQDEFIESGNYTFSVYAKGSIRTGAIVLRVFLYRTHASPSELVPIERFFQPSTTSWDHIELPFTIPPADPNDPNNLIWHIKFQIGIENVDGWVIFDEADLRRAGNLPDANLFDERYDPSFDQASSLFWNYLTDNEDYPTTHTFKYFYRLLPNPTQTALYPWIGDPPYSGSDVGIVKGNQMRASIHYIDSFATASVGKSNSVSLKMNWNVLPFSANGETFRGKASLWVFTWDKQPPQHQGVRMQPGEPPLLLRAIPLDLPLNTDAPSANQWVSRGMTFTTQVIDLPNYPHHPYEEKYFTFTVIVDLSQGWLSFDEFRVGKNLIMNGGFERGDAFWTISTPGFWGTGGFVADQTMFTPPAEKQYYLAITNLAQGYTATPIQDIQPGKNYQLSFWYRGQDFLDNGFTSGKLNLQYYKNGTPFGTSFSQDLPLNPSAGAFKLFQTAFQHSGPLPDNDTEQYQLRVGVEKLGGWIQFDDIILKPQEYAVLDPDPTFPHGQLTCNNQELQTQTNMEAYQWYRGNPPKFLDTDSTQVATTSGNYSVEYTQPTNNNRIPGFAEPIQVVDAPAITITSPPGDCIWSLFPVQFAATVVSQEPITSWLWEFPDNTTSTDPSPKHYIFGGGWVTVKLTISTANCTVQATKKIYSYEIYFPPFCQLEDTFDDTSADILATSDIANEYETGDSYVQQAVQSLVIDKTTTGMIRKYDISDLAEVRAVEEELNYLSIGDLLAVYDQDGEKISKGEQKKALDAATKRRNKDHGNNGGGQP